MKTTSDIGVSCFVWSFHFLRISILLSSNPCRHMSISTHKCRDGSSWYVIQEALLLVHSWIRSLCNDISCINLCRYTLLVNMIPGTICICVYLYMIWIEICSFVKYRPYFVIHIWVKPSSLLNSRDIKPMLDYVCHGILRWWVKGWYDALLCYRDYMHTTAGNKCR